MHGFCVIVLFFLSLLGLLAKIKYIYILEEEEKKK